MRRQLGVSTIGIMLAVVVLAVLAMIIVPQLTNPDKGRAVTAQQQMQTIRAALDNYKSDNGFYPSDDQGLRALVTEPDIAPIPRNWNNYIKALPQDPWGNDYQYENDNGSIRLWSFGPGGKDGNTPLEYAPPA